ncbi:hypothetical protein TNCV_3849921 [Trichonephila clavipes]|nr:hypothetical protein TNCV_3849921 [Trichonephila clavipes]
MMSPFERYPSQRPTPIGGSPGLKTCFNISTSSDRKLRVTMWFQLALNPDNPLLGVLVGSDNLLYFRIMDIAHLLGRKNDTTFSKRYSCDIVLGKDVLPLTQKYLRYTANAHLVTRDTAYRILCRENLELAE